MKFLWKFRSKTWEALLWRQITAYLTLEVEVAGCQVHPCSQELGHPFFVEGKRQGEGWCFPFLCRKYKQFFGLQGDQTSQFSSVQSLSCVWRFVTPWTAAHQASLCITSSQSLHQSTLKEINPECSLEGLMLKLKLQFFGHVIRRTDSWERPHCRVRLRAGGAGGQHRMIWLGDITDSVGVSLSKLWEIVKDGGLACCSPWGHKESDTSYRLNNSKQTTTGLSSRQSDSVKVLKVLVTQSCMTLSNRMDCGPPGSSVHGILQATILEWGAISFSRGSSQHRDRTQVSCIIGRSVAIWAKWFKALLKPGSSVTWKWFSCKEQEM